ncbi:GNAT family N-acetyltransferase [Marinimicrobium sp. ABcell2]|uniref:GNAT family N-acetyltransferase n=1 Tax=Marinimicrobium sp. ABcell2 TaxID=3069751 RepID=UPI0027B0BDCF|nr:GNAT family N-acetyltransferase [Marinimicrobium sp. ABcell2]MDQ2076258.1 GNAT family N-acetyltransferase [Marinimicrobium sp. ABcell2]
MELVKATSSSDWASASELLSRVVNRLALLEKPLWTLEQVSTQGLKEAYRLEELHFLTLNNQRIGLAFLQESDPMFWPEITNNDSLFVHKLALDPALQGKGNGRMAISKVLQEAIARGLNWLRLDCDDRPELHRFYQKCGFAFVDLKIMGAFNVARYQRLTSMEK